MSGDPRNRLAVARLYLCTDARRERGDLAGFLDAVLGAGADIVQLREKGLEAREELALLEVFSDACRRHGALLAVNDRADVALAAGADVLHLGQGDLPLPVARRILGDRPLIGRSSHSPDQADAAASEPGTDYFCAGPVWATPTKPGRPGTGLGLIEHVAVGLPDRPWFAIGGITLGNLDDVLAAGATRVVVVRAITDADDPAAAAGEFAARLAAVGLAVRDEFGHVVMKLGRRLTEGREATPVHPRERDRLRVKVVREVDRSPHAGTSTHHDAVVYRHRSRGQLTLISATADS